MKIENLTIMLVLLFAGSAFAGNDKKEEKRDRFAIGAFFSPAYDFRYVHFPDDGSEFMQEFKQLLKEYDRGKFGYTTGLNFSWFISKRFTLETGLWFSNMGYSLKWMDLYTASGEPRPFEKGKLRYIYGSLNLPVKMNFNIITRPFKVFISAGMTANLSVYAKYRYFLVYTDGSKESYYNNMKDNSRDVNLSALASAGLEYEFLKHFSFRFEPMFIMNIIPVNTADVKYYLWSAGGNIGIFYLFR